MSNAELLKICFDLQLRVGRCQPVDFEELQEVQERTLELIEMMLHEMEARR